MNNTERQRAFKARMRAAGMIQVTVWCTPDQKNQIMNLVNDKNFRSTTIKKFHDAPAKHDLP